MSDREALLAEAKGLERGQLLAQAKALDNSQLADPKLTSPGDKIAKGVEDFGSAVMDGPVGKSLAWVGDKLERYVDAPVRAQIGSLQNGDSIGESYMAGGRQIGRDTLPSTPSGKEIMARTGLSTTPLSEHLPSLFTDSGEGLALKKGGMLDASPAGVYGAVIQPSTWAIPADALVGGASKAVGTAAKVGARVAEGVTPLVELANSAGKLGQKAVFKTGEVLTGGTLKADKAIAAAEKLSGTQMLFPDAYLKGAGKEVGAARDVIKTQEGFVGPRAPAEAGKGAIPGSQEAVQRIKDVITRGEDQAFRHPGSTELLRKLDNIIASGHDVPVSTVDNLIQDLNNVEYTVQGNQRAIEPRWKGPVGEARGELNKLLNSTEAGQGLQAAKDDFSALKTAQGGGSKLRGIMSFSGGIPAAAATAVLGHPAVAALAAVASRAIAPRTYFQIVGLAKLPAQAAEGLMTAYRTGKSSALATTISELAQQYPQEMARFSTALAEHSDTSMKAAENDSPIQRRLRRTGE